MILITLFILSGSSRTYKDSIPNINEVSIGVSTYDECSFMDVKRKGSGSFHTSASTFLPDVLLGPGILRF